MRLLVCGGRKFSDYERLRKRLNSLHHIHGFTLVIHGGASGADRLAGRWAQSLGIPVAVEKAEWHLWGNSSGPERNGRMIRKWMPQLVAAFPGGVGTADMVDRAERRGIKVVQL